MLDDVELREWLENLAPSNPARRRIIIELIRHKGEDHMISDDLLDCRKALALLDAEQVTERAGPKTLAPVTELETEH